LGDSDFYRTRLTHSLEVAQIAAGIARQFDKHEVNHPAHQYLPPANLIQSIGFTHDLGHPPFGHGGEVALNYCMRENGGFEGNGQTLRILTKLENFSANHGSDLTRRTLLGVLKYPAPYSATVNPSIVACLDPRPTSIQIIDRIKSKPPKCFMDSERGEVDWILEPLAHEERQLFQTVEPKVGKHQKPKYKSFDSSIMDLADDIAYGVHDLEDAIALGLISERAFRGAIMEGNCPTFLDALKAKYPNETQNNVYENFVMGLFGDGGLRKRFIGRLVHHFMTCLSIETIEDFKEPMIRYRAVMATQQRQFLDALQALVVNEVINSPNVQHLEFKGQKMVVSVFEAFQSDPKAFLPSDAYQDFAKADNDPRVICDHVAGMTDGFLLKTYDRLFSPRMGSVFDKL
jgi:dGTPase